MILLKSLLAKSSRSSSRARERAPAVDRRIGTRFWEERDRRGLPILVTYEPDQTITVIAPGGTQLPSAPDQRDIPLLWRYARWDSADQLARDLPPSWAYPVGLAELVDSHRGHAEWMLERSSLQLRALLELLEVGTAYDAIHDYDCRPSAPQSTLLAYRRSLYVYGELKAACKQHSIQTEGPAPAFASSALDDAETASARAEIPVSRIEKLIGCDSRVTIRRGLRSWQGDAYAAVLVFLKLYEAERALAEERPISTIQNRLRLLEGALTQAIRADDTRTALHPIRRRCRHSLEIIRSGIWTPRDQRFVHTCLTVEIVRLHCRPDKPSAPPKEPEASLRTIGVPG